MLFLPRRGLGGLADKPAGLWRAIFRGCNPCLSDAVPRGCQTVHRHRCEMRLPYPRRRALSLSQPSDRQMIVIGPLGLQVFQSDHGNRISQLPRRMASAVRLNPTPSRTNNGPRINIGGHSRSVAVFSINEAQELSVLVDKECLLAQ